MTETWKPVKNSPSYEVSSVGRVRSINRTIIDTLGRPRKLKSVVLKCTKDNGGYLTVGLSEAGVCVTRYVHRLAAAAFLPDSLLPEVNHKDADKSNNCFGNLEWTDRQGNMLHSAEAGLGLCKLNRLKVQELRLDRSKGMLLSDIAAKYGIAANTASNIVNGKLWKQSQSTL